jgi:hypothetical protein
VIRNNIIFDCSATGITAAPHAAVPKIQNVTIVNNTIVRHRRGVLIRWSKARNVAFSNNAIYCPGSTAIDASEIDNATCSNNYVQGRLVGVTIDNDRFYDGGDISATFVQPYNRDFWPKSGSGLIGHADPAFVPKLDFNHTARESPFDVGAYESDGHLTNPGWQVQARFKRAR